MLFLLLLLPSLSLFLVADRELLSVHAEDFAHFPPAALRDVDVCAASHAKDLRREGGEKGREKGMGRIVIQRKNYLPPYSLHS